MCLNTFSRKVSITNKDIVCYKSGFYADGKFKTLFQSHYYPFNEIVVVEKELNIYPGTSAHFDNITVDYYTDDKSEMIYHITFGCHSSLTIKRLIDYLAIYRTGFVVKCIIPTGSQIVKDATGLIVSNKIIITKQIYKYEENKKFRKDNLK